MAELIIKAVMSAIPPLIKYIQNKRKRIETDKKTIEKKGMIPIINLSGHPLSSLALKRIKDEWNLPFESEILEFEIRSLNLTELESYFPNLIDFIVNLVKSIIKKGYLPQLLNGEYVLIPSGLSALATMEIVVFHALSGHFPKVAFPFKASFGFSITDPFDLHVLRTELRDLR